MIVSDGYKQTAMKPETDRIPLVLLKLECVSWTSPIRIVGNTSSITTSEGEYEAYGLSFTAPTEGSQDVVASVIIEDITRYLMAFFRSTNKPISLEASIIFADSPNVVELGPWDFQVNVASFSGYNVSLDLIKPNILKNSMSSFVLDPIDFPGLYLGS